MLDEWPEANNQFFTWRQVFFQSHPRAWPVVQIAAVDGSIGGRTAVAARFTLEVFAFDIVRAMELITILNHCHRHRGFVYQNARFSPDKKTIEVGVRRRSARVATSRRRVTIILRSDASSSSLSGGF